MQSYIADLRIPPLKDRNHDKFHADPLATIYAFKWNLLSPVYMNKNARCPWIYLQLPSRLPQCNGPHKHHCAFQLGSRFGRGPDMMIHIKILTSEDFLPLAWSLSINHFVKWVPLSQRETFRSTPSILFQIKKIVMQEILCKFCIENEIFFPFIPPSQRVSEYSQGWPWTRILLLDSTGMGHYIHLRKCWG